MPLLSLEQIVTFLPTAIVLTLAPGPDILMVLSLGVSRGARAAVSFGVGAAFACLIQTALLAFGISLIIKQDPVYFTILKIAGCLYLIWLGIQAFRGSLKTPSSGDPLSGRTPLTGPTTILFLKGMGANLTNPKVIIFYLSFLPKYVSSDPALGSEAWQMMQLGTLFMMQAAVVFSIVGLTAGKLRHFLLFHPRVPVWLDRIAAFIFVALGISIIFAV